MQTNETYSKLVETRMFSGLSEAGLRSLAEIVEPRQFGQGDVLFSEGAHCGELILVRQGKLQLQMRVPGHGSIPILTLGPGQLVAWSAVLGTGEMTASAVALEVTEAFALPGTKLKELCGRDHEFGYLFMERLAGALSRRLVATRLQLLDLFARETPRIPIPEEQHG